MAIITYPLNDVEYTAEDAELFNCTRNSGVYTGNDFTCTVSGTNNIVVIGEGVGWIRNGRFAGKVFANREPEMISVGDAHAIYPRIDVVGVRFDTATNATQIVVKNGEASANPVIPEIVQTDDVYELYFCSVYREPAATAIKAENVTDLRLDANYCGLMGDAITSIDTTEINVQFKAYLDTIRRELAEIKVGKIDAYSRDETLSLSTKALLGLAENALPDDAFNNLLAQISARAKVATGYYFGTGTYGASGATKLSFDFPPKAVIVFSKDVASITNANCFALFTTSSNIAIHGTGTGGINIATSSQSTSMTHYISGNVCAFYGNWDNTNNMAEHGPTTGMNISGKVYHYVAWG